MFAWWDSLTVLQQVFACIGIPATLILIVQTVLLMFGIGDGEGADADIDPDGFDVGEAAAAGDDGLTLFTVRGIVAMFCVGGWAGIVFVDLGLSNILSILLASVCGIAALVGIAYLMKAVLKLQSSGNIRLGSALGKVGEVYIPIPPNGEGRGKISITVQDRLIEVDAISESTEPLKTGETVRVVSTNESGLVVVEKVVK
ncbi:MAG: hypothetical protein IJ428_00860 [Clostridia bacterium]|nr:hypothetical protein [Clostridia bacterium]